jgi:CHAT domain-containing protein
MDEAERLSIMFTANETKIRQYLLGALTERARKKVEKSLLITDEGLERIERIEEALIDDYLTGDLSETERLQFENIFLCTAERRSKLYYLRALRDVAAQKQMESEPATEVVSFPRRLARNFISRMFATHQWPKLAAAILLVVCGAFVGLRIRDFWREPFDKSLIALNRAYAAQRPLETRIAGFNYAPFAPSRGANGAETEARVLREHAQRIVLDGVAENPTAANKHALGKFYLADKQFDLAIEQFKAALNEMPDVADLHNDLGAALLEKAKKERVDSRSSESLLDLAASLESLQKALKLQGDFPVAVFNRALCLQEMQLPKQAAEAWKQYLQLDSQSEWASEARRRLELIEKSPSKTKLDDEKLYQDFLLADADGDPERVWDLFCQGYSTTGNSVTERLIDDHLAARTRLDAGKAAHTLNQLERLGTLSLERSQDPYVRDIARYYRRVTPSQARTLAQARRQLNEGRKIRRKSQTQAIGFYTAALSLFRQAGNDPESRLAACLMGRSYLRQSNLKKSSALFGDLAAPKNKYLWLRGEALNGMADQYYSLDMAKEVIRDSQLVVSTANKIRNISLLIRGISILVDQYKDLGDREQSLYYNFQALNVSALYPLSQDERWTVNGLMALNFYSCGYQAAAIAYQQEALDIISQTEKSELQLSRAYSHLGAILGNEARYDEAIQFLKKACDIGAQMKGDRRGLSIEAYSGLGLANLQRKSGDFNSALKSYERVIELSRELEFPANVFDVYRGKALTEIALGHKAQAQLDLENALKRFERNLKSILSEKQLTSFIDKEYDIYDAAIGFTYDENPRKAFNLSEKSRARALLKIVTSAGAKSDSAAAPIDLPRPLELEAIQRQLSGPTKIIQYACLPDRLIIWCFSRETFAHKKIEISLDSLNEQAEDFISVVSSGSQVGAGRMETVSNELYRTLIEPIEAFLSPGDQLCFIPDKLLNQLPFAALFSSRKQRFLIEDHAFLVSPSSSIFLFCSARANQKFHPEAETPLVVGNPRFNRAAHPSLPDLPEATREAKEIAGMFKNSRLLIEEQATEAEVKSRLQTATIFHIAAHGVVDKRIATESELALGRPAEGDQEDGAFHSHEIARMRLPHTRLAVLSACQSGVERYYRGEGMIGLSRSFLAAQVPTVVASLWAVDSDSTAIMMTSFHRHLQQHPAYVALRLAQLDMLKNTDNQRRNPYYWAAFSAFGGDRVI